MNLEYFKYYSIPACLLDCKERFLVERCKCRDVYMPNKNESKWSVWALLYIITQLYACPIGSGLVFQYIWFGSISSHSEFYSLMNTMLMIDLYLSILDPICYECSCKLHSCYNSLYIGMLQNRSESHICKRLTFITPLVCYTTGVLVFVIII